MRKLSRKGNGKCWWQKLQLVIRSTKGASIMTSDKIRKRNIGELFMLIVFSLKLLTKTTIFGMTSTTTSHLWNMNKSPFWLLTHTKTGARAPSFGFHWTTDKYYLIPEAFKLCVIARYVWSQLKGKGTIYIQQCSCEHISPRQIKHTDLQVNLSSQMLLHLLISVLGRSSIAFYTISIAILSFLSSF